MFDPLGRFRAVALAEGLSYVVLVFVGMPLKYLAGEPATVEVTGWIHGLLFISYVILGVQVAAERDWTLRFRAWAFAAAMVPGGTFWLDRHLRNESTEASSASVDHSTDDSTGR